MVCQKCKTEIADDYKFCPYCGTEQAETIKHKRVYGNGSGSVYKRKDLKSKPWIALAPAKISDGKVNRTVIGYFKTQKEARDALSIFLKAPTDKLHFTVEQIFDEWKSTAYDNISADLQANYNAAWLKLRTIKNCKIKEIRTAQLQEIIDYYKNPHHKELQGGKLAIDKDNNPVISDGLSHSSLSKIKILMSLLFEYACKNDIVAKNYANFVVLPKKEKSEKERFTDLELETIKKNIGIVPYADYILVMCYTGFRVNEFLSLKKFNFIDGDIPVLVGGSKTEAGKNRTIPIHNSIIDIVRDCLELNGETIFCNKETGNEFNVRNFRNNYYYPALEKMGLPKYGCHATRRTFSTRLNSAGVSDNDLIALMGHTDISVDRDYYINQEAKTLYDAIRKLS